MGKKLSFSIAVNLLTENFKKGTNAVKSSLRSIQMQMITFAAALGAGGLGLAGLLTRFKDVARETSRVTTALKNVSTGTKGFTDNLRFVTDIAKKYGLEVNALTGNFAKFTASATQANMPMEHQKKVFESLSRSCTAFGLSAEDTNGVFLALSQMMGKGKISSEELRKQMGERIPIAMQAMASAAGVSMSGLEKLLQQGKLMSSEIIPKFAESLNNMIPNVDTDNVETSLNRLSNTFGEVVQKAGIVDKFKYVIDKVTVLIEVAGNNIMRIILGVVGFIAGTALKKVYTSYKETTNRAIAEAERLNKSVLAAETQRIDAEKKLTAAQAEMDALSADATAKKRIAAENKVNSAQKQLRSATARANDLTAKAQLANVQATAMKSANIFQKSGSMIVATAKNIGVSLKAAFNSIWIGLIITAIMELGLAIKDFITKTSALERSQKNIKNATSEFNAEVTKEKIKIDILFDRLKAAKEGTKAYQKVKDEILSQYGEYLHGLSEEIQSLRNVAGAYNAITAAAYKASKARAFDKYSSKAMDDYNENTKDDIEKIREKLIKRFGEKQGTDYFRKVSESLDANSKLSPGMQMVIDKGFTVSRRAEISTTGTGSFGKIYMSNEVNDLIKNVRAARTAFETEIKKYKEVYLDESKPEGKDTPVKTLNEQIKDARDEVSLLKKDLKDLQSGKTKSNDYAKDIADKAKALKEAQDKLSYLTTGKPYSASSESNATEKRYEADWKLQDEDRKRQIEKQKFDLEMEQAGIDILDDSFEKRTKQTLLNLKKEKLEIDEFKNNALKEQREYLKTKYEKTHGSDKGFGAYYDNLPKGDLENIMPEGLRPSDIAKIVEDKTKAAQTAQAKGLKDINKDLSDMLKEQEQIHASSLNRQLADIDKYYDDEKKKLGEKIKENADYSAEYYDKIMAQIEANRQRDKLQVNTDDKMQKLDFGEQIENERAAGLESIGMTELVEEKKLEITKKYLQLRIDLLKTLADAGNEDAKNQIELYQAELDKLNQTKPVTSLKGLADKAIFNVITAGFKKVSKSEAEAEAKTNHLLSTITQNAGMVANITSELQSMFGGLSEELDQALSTVGNIAEGFATRGISGGIMAVIGEGMKLFSLASEAAARHQKALKEIADARLASQRAYNLLLKEQNLLMKEAVSIFGEKQITIAANAIKEYGKTMGELKDKMRGDFKPDESREKYLEKMAASDGFVGDFFGVQLKGYRNQLDKYNKGVLGLEKATIVTGHKKTGLFGWGKGKDIYSSILDVYDDVIDKEGELNTERIKSILETEKMSDETKAYLQNLLDLQDAAQKAQDELKNYLQTTFGSLGDDIMTSLENAIKDRGIDAWEEFGKAGAKVIEQLGKQIAYELFFADKFKDLQSQLEAIYGSSITGETEQQKTERIGKEAADLVGEFYQGIGGQMELAEGFLENWKKEAEKSGFDLWTDDPTSQTASSGGFQSMDQDTGNRLDGRFAALQMSGLRIEGFLSSLTISTNNIFNRAVNISDELQKHTNLLSEIKTIQRNNFYEVEGTKSALKKMAGALDRIDKNTSKL